MARIRELAEAALRTEQPAADLEAVVRDLIAPGEACEVIGGEPGALVVRLREGGGNETTEEEVVLEVLDRLEDGALRVPGSRSFSCMSGASFNIHSARRVAFRA